MVRMAFGPGLRTEKTEKTEKTESCEKPAEKLGEPLYLPPIEHLKGGVRYPAGSCGWGSESPLCAKAQMSLLLVQ